MLRAERDALLELTMLRGQSEISQNSGNLAQNSGNVIVNPGYNFNPSAPQVDASPPNYEEALSK